MLFNLFDRGQTVLHVHWKDWCWSWRSNTLATWCEELTHWKRPWHWERLKAGGEGDNREWDGWMASLTQWTWVFVYSGSWWWTGRPGMLRFMGSQRVGHYWVTELNWIEITSIWDIICLTFAVFMHVPRRHSHERTLNQSSVVRDVTIRWWCTSADQNMWRVHVSGFWMHRLRAEAQPFTY